MQVMKLYADEQYYREEYLCDSQAKIPGGEFNRLARLASAEIRLRTYGRVEEMAEVPDEVKMCCCEVTEKLYSRESARDENGLVLQSYNTDGDSGSYKTDDVSDESIQRSVDRIVQKWLINTGLLYCGGDDEPEL